MLGPLVDIVGGERALVPRVLRNHTPDGAKNCDNNGAQPRGGAQTIAVATISTRTSGANNTSTPMSDAGGFEVMPSFCAARA